MFDTVLEVASGNGGTPQSDLGHRPPDGKLHDNGRLGQLHRRRMATRILLSGWLAAVGRVGENAARQPWILIDEFLEGSFGCNSFGTTHEHAHSFGDGLLIPGEVFSTAKGCDLGDNDRVNLMASEESFGTAMQANPTGIEVEVSEGLMRWQAGGEELFFRATDAPPVPTTSPPPNAVGPLDSSPGVVDQVRVTNDSREAPDILRSYAPATVRIEPDFEFWWGYNSNDRVIAGIAKGDVEPPQYQVFTCTDS